MITSVLGFRTPLSSPRSRADTPPPEQRLDLGFASLPLFVRVRDALQLAGKMIAACRAISDADRFRTGGEPPVFFFDRAAQVACNTERPKPSTFPKPHLAGLAGRMPSEAAAWDALPDLLDDALTLLTGSLDARRAGRAVDGLRTSADDLSAVLPQAAELIGLLDVPDEQVVLALHPAARVGVRVMLRGVADANQLHVLLADAMTGDPARGLLPGRRPDPRIVDAYRDGRTVPTANVATARFQLFRSTALQPGSTLPEKFAGADHWLWGHESPAALPLIRGERVLLLGDPAFPATWQAARKFPRLSGEMDRLAILTRAEVEGWLATRCPAFRPSGRAASVAA